MPPQQGSDPCILMSLVLHVFAKPRCAISLSQFTLSWSSAFSCSWPECSRWDAFIPPCDLRNFVAERCQMTNLMCSSILPAQTLVSPSALSRGDRKWEKRQRNFHAVTWSSISRDAGPATAQGNHQCQRTVCFHAVGQEKGAVHRQKARIHIGIRSVDLHFV